MSANDEAYMHEINRLEGERNYWRTMHAKVDSELAVSRGKVSVLREELHRRMAWKLTKALDERTRERDEAREIAVNLYRILLHHEAVPEICDEYGWLIESVLKQTEESVA